MQCLFLCDLLESLFVVGLGRTDGKGLQFKKRLSRVSLEMLVKMTDLATRLWIQWLYFGCSRNLIRRPPLGETHHVQVTGWILPSGNILGVMQFNPVSRARNACPVPVNETPGLLVASKYEIPCKVRRTLTYSSLLGTSIY